MTYIRYCCIKRIIWTMYLPIYNANYVTDKVTNCLKTRPLLLQAPGRSLYPCSYWLIKDSHPQVKRPNLE